jgi:hypothetical protein
MDLFDPNDINVSLLIDKLEVATPNQIDRAISDAKFLREGPGGPLDGPISALKRLVKDNAMGAYAACSVVLACGSGAAVFSDNPYIKAAGASTFGIGATAGLWVREVRRAQARNDDFITGVTQPKLAGSPPPNP